MTRPVISNVIGFDDFPFPRSHCGDVLMAHLIMGTVGTGESRNARNRI